MIYEYPEKFVVPVVYVEDLKEKSMNRDWDIKYLKVEKLVIPDKKMDEENIYKDEYETESFYKDIIGNKKKNYLDFTKESLKKPYNDNMFYDNDIKESLEDNDLNSMLKDIDDDYANSETLNM